MASLSPAVHASRPASFIDPQRQAEYPVLLGESLKPASGVRNHFYSVQYNWKPRNLSTNQKTVIRKANAEASADAPYVLTIHEPASDNKPYRYAGGISQTEAQNGSTRPSPEDQTSPLALVFNQEKSAFVLEKISAALDFNLTSAPSQTRADVQAHPQLPLHRRADQSQAVKHKLTSSLRNDDDDDDNNDDEPDAANPYDYRHFLEEAKANAEKGLGGRTPIPGGLSGMPSPVPGPSRFRAGSGPGTPVQRPLTSAPSAQIVKKKKKVLSSSSERRPDPSRRPGAASSSSTTATTQKPTTAPSSKPKPKHTPSTSTSTSKPKPLSKERISDSDDSDDEEEMGDTITLSRPSTANSLSRPRDQQQQQQQQQRQQHKSATTTAKSGYANSPRIEVDEAADLVIDMGSPPPVAAARRRVGVGAGAGLSSPFAIARAAQPVKSAAAAEVDSEEEEEDAEGEVDDDVVMQDADADADADGDVEDFILGSPRASTTRALSVSVVGRMDVEGDADEDEDEDDELAAELEAALENDDEDGGEEGGDGGGGGGVGLGISTGGGGGGGRGGGGEDESEVSEEE